MRHQDGQGHPGDRKRQPDTKSSFVSANPSPLSPPTRRGHPSASARPPHVPCPRWAPSQESLLPLTPSELPPRLGLRAPLPHRLQGFPLPPLPPRGTLLRAPPRAFLRPLCRGACLPTSLSSPEVPPPPSSPAGLPQPRDSRGAGGAAGVFLPRPRAAPWKGRGLRAAPSSPPVGPQTRQGTRGCPGASPPCRPRREGRGRARSRSQLRPPQPRDREVAGPASQFRFGGKSQQRAKTSWARSTTSWGIFLC